MKLNKKFLSLASLCALSINLNSLKPVSTHFNLKDVKSFASSASLGIANGALLEPILVVPTATAITAYKSVKEKPINKNKFKNILKSAANKSFKIVKWLGIMSAGLCIASRMASGAMHGCIDLTNDAVICGEITVGVLSWIGQKLTENKNES